MGFKYLFFILWGLISHRFYQESFMHFYLLIFIIMQIVRNAHVHPEK